MIISYMLRRAWYQLLSCLQPSPGRYDLACTTDWPTLLLRVAFLVVYSVLALNILSVHVLVVAFIEHRPGALLHMKAPVLWFIVMHMAFNLYETIIMFVCAAREKVSVCLLLSFWLLFANDKTQDIVAIFVPGTQGINYPFEMVIMLLFLDQLVYDAICGVIQTVGLGSSCDETSCGLFVRYYLHCRYRTMEVYGWQVYELPTPNGVGIHKTPHSPQPVRRGSLHPLDDAKDNANGLLVVSKTCHDLRVLEMEELSASSPLARNELFGVGMVKTL